MSNQYFQADRIPPEAAFRPHGQMLAVQIHTDAEGHRDPSLKNIVMPQSAMDTWRTPTYVVIAAGPECKWTKRGDVVPVAKEVVFPIVRVDGWVFLCCHEQQSLGTVPSMRIELDEPKPTS